MVMTDPARASRRVLYIQYTNPGHYPPLEHSAHLLADADADVLMLGVGAPDDAMVVRPHARIDVRLMPLEAPGWRQKVHYARFVMWAANQGRTWRPDWIYASDPLSCPAALALASVAGAELLYHEHDSPESDVQPSSRLMRSVMAARRRIASQAALCVLPNEERADVFRRETGARRVQTVWNTPLRREIPSGAADRVSGQLRLWYHGSVTPPNLPIAVVHALAELPESVSLEVVGYETRGHAGYGDTLRVTAERLGIATRVSISPPMSRSALIATAARADIGVALLPAVSARLNERAMVGASNKPFDYMAVGLALLVPDAPAWRNAFVAGGFGLACDPESPASIAAAIDHLLNHPAALAEMRRRAPLQIADAWNYETTFAPVLSTLLNRARGTADRQGAA
jgi:glycosyltransferase involved in cell wall biosynthesis